MDAWMDAWMDGSARAISLLIGAHGGHIELREEGPQICRPLLRHPHRYLHSSDEQICGVLVQSNPSLHAQNEMLGEGSRGNALGRVVSSPNYTSNATIATIVKNESNHSKPILYKGEILVRITQPHTETRKASQPAIYIL